MLEFSLILIIIFQINMKQVFFSLNGQRSVICPECYTFGSEYYFAEKGIQ